MPSTTYQLIEKAMAERKQLLCVYDGFARELCPTMLGHTISNDDSRQQATVCTGLPGLPEIL